MMRLQTEEVIPDNLFLAFPFSELKKQQPNSSFIHNLFSQSTLADSAKTNYKN